MNNGKVRIYELSRELNLDNKDILAVCDRLNISVKSHSSTISESDAERIRKTAEKYVASHSSPGKPTPPDRAAVPPRESAPRPNDPKKQQILEIRRPKVRNGANSKQSDFDDETTPPPSLLVATPPKQVLTQQHQPSPKPSPNRPVLPKQSDTTPMASSETVGAFDADTYEEAVESVSETQQPEDWVAVEELENDLTSGAEQKQLSSPPPPRALAQPPSRPQQQNQQSASRPVLKRSKPEQGTAEEGQSTEVVAKPIRTKEQSPVVVEAKENKPPRRENPTKPKPVADLQRPQPPRKSAPPAIAIAPNKRRNEEVAAERTEDDEEIELESGPGTELLQRPTLPRPAKKTQVWEEDDEESGDFPSKAKAAKTKRTGRVKPTIDEDEDLVDDDLDIPTPVIVSLSLARPAKPKSATAKPVAALLTTSYAKAKKPAPGQSSSSSGQKSRGRQSAEAKEERPVKLVLMGTMTVQELASTLAVPETEIIRRLFARGIAVNITQTLDIPTIHQVAEELGVEVETAEKEAEAKKLIEMLDEADLENLHRRPPVVTIMGHVDHGKTTLLDSIRKTKVAQGEAGGITQHIGAYHVDVEHDGKTQQVVFLDTPGHEAFTAMRARGARVTDIAILVVAADDGVRPQTIEAISHAKAAKVPIIIAINKIDKEEAQPERVKQELTEYGLVAEEWGGETIMVPVSAIRGENLDTLLEMILLVAEVEDLNANPNRAAKGTVIEAHLDKARGPVATLLVQNGTLRVGDIIVAGSALGKVRAMIDDRFQRVEVASPSFAVEVLGLREVPRAGDEFDVFQNEKEASAIAAARAAQARQSRLLQGSVSLSAFSQQAKEGELKELNLILKADVQGSLEAIVGALRQLPQREVQLRLLLAAPGEITETDIDLASASNGVILGFNTTFASGARQAADQAGVDVREYNIIYKLLDDVQGAMEGLLEPELVEEALGSVEVRTVFPISRGAVAGCYVLSGKAIRNCKVRVRRGNNVIHEGILDSLKRMKDDVKEVNAGYECGISLNAFSDWVEGDIIEAYRMVTKRRTLSS